MAAKKRKMVDAHSRAVVALLEREYLPRHPKATVEAFRRHRYSLWVRITDPDFARKSIAEREDMVWPILEQLPEEVQANLAMLLLLTPAEREKSIMSQEFDDPSPSLLDS